METQVAASFFSKDRMFYRRLFTILLTVSLQNVVAYSVNMADNLMLGSYSQVTLSGAATVNQIFFMVQQLSVGICDSLVIIGSQYWGRQNIRSLRKVGGCGLKLAAGGGLLIWALCLFFPSQLMAIFTTDASIASEGMAYMAIIKYTFVLFLITQAILATLRCAETVRIAFIVSCVSLVVNVGINYCLIFGKFGLPEMGIRGAAIGTLIARIVELIIVLVYALKVDQKVRLFSENPLKKDPGISHDFSVLATQILVLMAFLMVTMGYMMPVMNGILRGGGDAKFTLYVNMISTWAVVVPLSFMSAFWWKLPVVWVVFFSQSDQVFKAPIAFLRFRTYKWARKLTRDN